MKSAVTIKRARDISRLYNFGQQWRGPEVKIFYLQNELNRNRYGILMSKENGTAVSRNRLKRRMREFLWKEKATAPPYYDMLIKLTSKCVIVKPRALKEDIKKWSTSLKK